MQQQLEFPFGEGKVMADDQKYSIEIITRVWDEGDQRKQKKQGSSPMMVSELSYNNLGYDNLVIIEAIMLAAEGQLAKLGVKALEHKVSDPQKVAAAKAIVEAAYKSIADMG